MRPGPHRQARLLAGFAQRGLPRRLAVVDVSARLQPDGKSLVQVEDHAQVTGDDCGGGDMGRRSMFVERSLEQVEGRDERRDGPSFARVGRWKCCYLATNRVRVDRIFQIRPSAGAGSADNSTVGIGSSAQFTDEPRGGR